MTGWWQRWRRARALERRAIPDALWQLTLVRFPFLAARSAAQVAALREMATLFLAEKEFSGARGLVTREIHHEPELPTRSDALDSVALHTLTLHVIPSVRPTFGKCNYMPNRPTAGLPSTKMSNNLAPAKLTTHAITLCYSFCCDALLICGVVSPGSASVPPMVVSTYCRSA